MAVIGADGYGVAVGALRRMLVKCFGCSWRIENLRSIGGVADDTSSACHWGSAVWGNSWGDGWCNGDGAVDDSWDTGGDGDRAQADNWGRDSGGRATWVGDQRGSGVGWVWGDGGGVVVDNWGGGGDSV